MSLLNDVGVHSWEDVAAVVAAVGGLYVLLRRAIRGAIKNVISDQLTEVRSTVVDRTKTIQPDANGGDSLPDLHRRLEHMDAAIDRTERGTFANSRDISLLSERFDEHLAAGEHTEGEAPP
jgi:hypothetical protein